MKSLSHVTMVDEGKEEDNESPIEEKNEAISA